MAEVKEYKIDGEQFTVTETITNGLCELGVEGLGMKVRVKASDEAYGYGYRIYFPGGSWKGLGNNPKTVLEKAAKEIIDVQKKKNRKELSDDLCDFFDQLS